MALTRAPGVYYEANERRVSALALGQTGVPVFIGVTRRGPLNAPVQIFSQAQFAEFFGDPLPDGYLGAALHGFFENGGETCCILRIARVNGRHDDEDIAQAARRLLPDGVGRPTLRVQARNPGSWGNGLHLDLDRVALQRTFLIRDADKGDQHLQLKTAHGITVGTLIEIQADETIQWTVVNRIEGKRISLVDPLAQAFASAAPTYVTAHVFSLSVRDLEQSERFENLSIYGNSPRFVERVVNDRSRLIHVTALRPDTSLDAAMPKPLANGPLIGGADGVADLGPEDFIGHDRGPADRQGLMCLVEYPQIDLIVLPDLMSAWQNSKRFKTLRDVEAVQEAAVSLCERSSNRFAILDMPPGGDLAEAQRWRRQFDSAHAALYFPWLITLEDGRRRAVPPSGHIAGIFSRSDASHGVHKAPANEIVEGIVDLEVLLQDAHLALLYDKGINCIRPFASRGLRVWGARTLSSDPEWRYINVRRTVSAIAQAIENGTQWAVFEPNNPALWKRLVSVISSFLAGLRVLGVLDGATPDEAFFVQCDPETNPPESVDRGMLVTRIGLAVSRPVEFIVFRLAQRLESEAQASEE
ncbi:MAG: phage tail sheath protein FI [Bradymonadia bacterium]|jgi:phage tail sheath protein FI